MQQQQQSHLNLPLSKFDCSLTCRIENQLSTTHAILQIDFLYNKYKYTNINI